MKGPFLCVLDTWHCSLRVEIILSFFSLQDDDEMLESAYSKEAENKKKVIQVLDSDLVKLVSARCFFQSIWSWNFFLFLTGTFLKSLTKPAPVFMIFKS